MLKNFTFTALLALAVSGCATGLNSAQTSEYRTMEAKGIVVNEKSASTGAWLGLLPGGGSFYAREPGLGVINLLTWPLSIFWDPVSGYQGSEMINYQISKADIAKIKLEKSKMINRQLEDGQIDSVQARRELQDLEDKYSY